MYNITAFDDAGNRVWVLDLYSGTAAKIEAMEIKSKNPEWIVQLTTPKGKKVVLTGSSFVTSTQGE